jgi:hypothetical protein
MRRIVCGVLCVAYRGSSISSRDTGATTVAITSIIICTSFQRESITGAMAARVGIVAEVKS